jgi:hypothetical protein
MSRESGEGSTHGAGPPVHGRRVAVASSVRPGSGLDRRRFVAWVGRCFRLTPAEEPVGAARVPGRGAQIVRRSWGLATLGLAGVEP